MTSFIVQKNINNGYGLAQSKDGKIFLIEEGLPKEHLTCKIIDSKRQYNIARIKKIIKPNPGRIAPPARISKSVVDVIFNTAPMNYRLKLKQKLSVTSLPEVLRNNYLKYQPTLQTAWTARRNFIIDSAFDCI